MTYSIRIYCNYIIIITTIIYLYNNMFTLTVPPRDNFNALTFATRGHKRPSQTVMTRFLYLNKKKKMYVHL